MVKKLLKCLPIVVFLALMVGVTYGGEYLFHASRTRVTAVTAKQYVDDRRLAVTRDEMIIEKQADGSGLLSFAFDAADCPLPTGMACVLYYAPVECGDAPMPEDYQRLELKIADISGEGVQSVAHVVLPQEYDEEDNIAHEMVIHMSSAAVALMLYSLPTAAVATDGETGETYVYTIITESNYFLSRSYTEKVPVEVARYNEGEAIISRGVTAMDLVVRDAVVITKERQKVAVQ